MYSSLDLRQQGRIQRPHTFIRKTSASLDLVQRLQLAGVLEGHHGCVNTVSFSPHDGVILVSGSDDKQICFWDWQAGTRTLRYHSGHRNNVFQARIMPESSNKTVVTCAADGQVRIAFLPEAGGRSIETKPLAVHEGRAHKLAVEPGSASCFFSCGEDGNVFHFDLREPHSMRREMQVCKASAYGGTSEVELNSIHCNPMRAWEFTVAGGDQYVRVFDMRRAMYATASHRNHRPLPGPTTSSEPVRQLTPAHLRRSRTAHITCAQFSCSGEIVASYNDENIYLFAADGSAHHRARRSSSSARRASSKRGRNDTRDTQNMGAGMSHPLESAPKRSAPAQQLPQQSAGQLAQARINTIQSDDSRHPALDGSSVQSASPRQEAGASPSRLASASKGSMQAADEHVAPGPNTPKVADLRPSLLNLPARSRVRARSSDAYGSDDEDSEGGGDGRAHSSSSSGEEPSSAEDDQVLQVYKGHRNARTVKGVSFMGASDEYVVSGSDDGHIYIWSKSDGQLRQWLLGDEDVVNCLEPHPTMPITLATSGIEHSIKLWTPTGEARQVPGADAAATMRANAERQGRGRSQMSMLFTPQMLASLMQLAPAELARRRRRRGRADEGVSDEESSGFAGMESDDDTDDDADEDLDGEHGHLPRQLRRDECTIS
ncbi:hypothetical protein WJX72_001905 [[Myrmecia] bisecta]|uniref:Uncharacterized protein n=1 Tax=[Myrmecia] bisecta TaxID=41462 RepID=A0AAW1QQH6_9CHLO